MIEKIRKNRDTKGVFAAILTDLSKASDCISHDLLLAKHVYGFDKTSLTFIHAYLSQQKQKTKAGSTFSEPTSIYFSWCSPRIYLRVAFTLTYICDLPIFNDHVEFGSYADDTTPFVYGKNFNQILDELEKHMAKIS